MKIVLAFSAFAMLLAAGEVKLGKPLSSGDAVTVDAVYAKPDNFVGKTVQVKGKVTEVCQAMGCWMNLVSDSKMIRVKVEHDGDIVFPKDSVGKMAVAEGKLTKSELTKDEVIAQAKHEAEEQGRSFDASKIKSGKTVYELQGVGAVIQE